MTTAVSRRELLAWALAIALAITAVTFARPGGVDAGILGPNTQVVYIATGDNFPDALGAATTAALGLGPVLLVQQNSIPDATMQELHRLQPPLIVIMGGTAVVSANVEAELESLPWDPDVRRFGGANRYETAAELSQGNFPTSGLYPRAARIGTDQPMSGPQTPQDVLETNILAPASGILVIQGGMSADGGPGGIVANCWLTVNGDEVTGTLRWVRDPGGFDVSCSTEGGFRVGPGEHTITLRAVTPVADANVNDRSLTVTWIPFGHRGQTIGIPDGEELEL